MGMATSRWDEQQGEVCARPWRWIELEIFDTSAQNLAPVLLVGSSPESYEGVQDRFQDLDAVWDVGVLHGLASQAQHSAHDDDHS